jgi:hypothetical protein
MFTKPPAKRQIQSIRLVTRAEDIAGKSTHQRFRYAVVVSRLWIPWRMSCTRASPNVPAHYDQRARTAGCGLAGAL